MGIVSRLTTLLKADAHGVMDAIEDRALLLKQHLREAEEEIQAKRHRLEALRAEQEQLGDEIPRLDETAKRLEDDVTLAVTGDKDDLARFAIKKLLALRHRRELAARRLEQARKEAAELEERLAKQELDFDALKARVKGYLARLQAARESEAVGLAPEPAIEEHDVEIELLRRKQEARHVQGGEE